MSFSVVGPFCISERWFSPSLLFQHNNCSSLLSSSQSSAESFFFLFFLHLHLFVLFLASATHLNMPGFMYISLYKGMQLPSYPAFPCSDNLCSFFNSGIQIHPPHFPFLLWPSILMSFKAVLAPSVLPSPNTLVATILSSTSKPFIALDAYERNHAVCLPVPDLIHFI